MGCEVYSMDGKVYYLDYELEFYFFNIEYYLNGMFLCFVVDVCIGNWRIIFEVNYFYSYCLGEDIYLIGYDIYNMGNIWYCIF